MKFSLYLLLLFSSTLLYARDIKPGKVHTSIALHAGWQYTDIAYGESERVPFYTQTSETYIGSTPALDFYAAPVLSLALGARIESQKLTLLISGVRSRVAYPVSAPSPLLYRFVINYHYLFLRDSFISPSVFAGVGFHRFTFARGFNHVAGTSTSDIIYTGKLYQIGSGVTHSFNEHFSITADATYRWVYYQNVGISADTSFPLTLWGKEIVGSLGAAWEF